MDFWKFVIYGIIFFMWSLGSLCEFVAALNFLLYKIIALTYKSKFYEFCVSFKRLSSLQNSMFWKLSKCIFHKFVPRYVANASQTLFGRFLRIFVNFCCLLKAEIPLKVSYMSVANAWLCSNSSHCFLLEPLLDFLRALLYSEVIPVWYLVYNRTMFVCT